MNLYDVIVAKKLSGGGGGDFETASVTFMSSSNSYRIYGYTVTPNAPVTLEFPLFEANGVKIFAIEIGRFDNLDPQVMPTLTGGVEFGDEYDVIGDGTFTAAGTSPITPSIL